jgi:hypothetical protein
MADEPKKLDEIVLGDDESLPEKFRGKSVADVLASYKEAEDLAHKKSEEVKLKENEIEELKTKPLEPIDDPVDDPIDDPNDDYSSLYGDDEYLTKDVVDKKLAAMEKKNAEALQAVEERAVSTAMARIERNTFIDSHPEIFDGKKPEDADAIIKKIAGAGFVAGHQTLEGGLQAIQEMAGEIGINQQPANDDNRDIPSDLKTIGEFESANDETAHMIDYHKKQKGKISDTLK